MSVDYTTTGFISSVKRRASFPNSQKLLTDANILQNASDEMLTSIVPVFLKNRDDFFYKTMDLDMPTDGIIDMPPRAIGSVLKDLQILDDQGNITRPPRLDSDTILNNDYGFYFKANKIYLSPVPPQSGLSLKLIYFNRPNSLVETDEAAQITAINTGTGDITCSSIPTTWTTSLTFDMIDETPNFDTLGESLTSTNITSNVITFDPDDLPDDLAVGDWIAETYESPIVQLPLEGHQLLAQLTAVKCLEEMGDGQNYQIAMGRYQQMLADVINIISPRSHAEGKFINNRTNFVKRGWYNWWR